MLTDFGFFGVVLGLLVLGGCAVTGAVAAHLAGLRLSRLEYSG